MEATFLGAQCQGQFPKLRNKGPSSKQDQAAWEWEEHRSRSAPVLGRVEQVERQSSAHVSQGRLSQPGRVPDVISNP
jgi:hypothetical protein